MTHACRLPLTGGAASFWDWTALLRSHRPRPFPRPTITTASGRHPHLPPVPSPPHYTAHQPLQGSHGLSGEQFSPGLSSQLPPPTHAYTHALLDKANIPLSRTLHLLRPHSLGGGDIALWAFGLGALSLLLHCSLWLPVVGPGRVPLALKGAQAPSHPGPPYSTALAAAGVASGGGAGPSIPPAKLSLSPHGAHTFHPSPPSLVPALGWAAPFGSRKAGGVCPYSRFTVATAPLPSAWDLSTCGGDGDAVAYCSGEAHEPCGRHLRWAGAAPLTLLCFRHSAISPSSDGAPITRSSPCPLPTPSCSSLPPKVLVPFFLCSQTTSGQLCCFLFNVPFFDIRHCCCYQRQMFILIASCSAHDPLPQDTLCGEEGLGHGRLGDRLPQSQGRWGPAPRMLQQSEQGGPNRP